MSHLSCRIRFRSNVKYPSPNISLYIWIYTVFSLFPNFKPLVLENHPSVPTFFYMGMTALTTGFRRTDLAPYTVSGSLTRFPRRFSENADHSFSRPLRPQLTNATDSDSPCKYLSKTDSIDTRGQKLLPSHRFEGAKSPNTENRPRQNHSFESPVGPLVQ